MIIFCGSQAQISAKKNEIRSENFIGHTICRWRTIYRTEPIITGNVRRPFGNTEYVYDGYTQTVGSKRVKVKQPALCSLARLLQN